MHACMVASVSRILLFLYMQDSNDTFDEDNLDRGQGGSWPFRNYVDQLVHDIFDPS